MFCALQADESRNPGVGGLTNLRPNTDRKKDRKNLTISALIAECEEYVKTDEFTKDLSDKLVNLFVGAKSDAKPPKIPENLRTKQTNKLDKPDKPDKNLCIPKFPRGSTYDNVGENNNEEDEGIGNDYSDDPKHEDSPTANSEGYDSACESGEIATLTVKADKLSGH